MTTTLLIRQQRHMILTITFSQPVHGQNTCKATKHHLQTTKPMIMMIMITAAVTQTISKRSLTKTPVGLTCKYLISSDVECLPK